MVCHVLLHQYGHLQKHQQHQHLDEDANELVKLEQISHLYAQPSKQSVMSMSSLTSARR